MDNFQEDLNSSDEIPNTPPNIQESANRASLELLPKKSKVIYEMKYNAFMEWCKNNKITKYSENVFLAYFSEELKHLSPMTLWSIFSMLKSTVKIKNNIDIANYHKLTAFLKQKSKGYKPKKSGIFEKGQFVQFILEAPDYEYLMIKVAFIIGICGACRREELMKMTISDIEDKGTVLIIKIPDSKNGIERIFTILNPNNSIDFLSYIRKYISLRPPNTETPRFFLKYSKNKCIRLPVGVNTFGKMPSVIAKYLNLPNSHLYTGHAFRRSSATMLANSGGDIITVKKHGGWKSTSVAEGYIDSTLAKKINVSNQILRNDFPSTSQIRNIQNELLEDFPLINNEQLSSQPDNTKQECITQSTIANNSSNISLMQNNNQRVEENLQVQSTLNKAQGLSFNNCTNCTFNINIANNNN